MKKIILATSNPHKLEEINAINKSKNIKFEVIKEKFNPEETGMTFEENAVIKAKAASKITGQYCLADDSGLCIDALEGAPGIYSSRYADSPEARINRVLKEMKSVPYDWRTAHFECTMVLTDGEGNILHKETGKIFGYIDDCPKGKNGFGYDPVFLLSEYDKTIAELDEEIKNQISHRANALNPMIKWIEENL